MASKIWQWYKKSATKGTKIFIISAIIASLIILFPQIQQAIANRPRTTSTAVTSWSAASFPVENFQAYTSPFGYRRSATGGSNWEFHNGLDLAAPRGSFIRNWWTGTVTKVGSGGNCGTHIVIRSGDWEHLYCHLEGTTGVQNGRRYMLDQAGGIVVWEGQNVPVGARMARVGMTGRTTGPHLHWTIKHRGNYVDPAMVLQAMFAAQQNNRSTTRNNTRNPAPNPRQLSIDEANLIRNSVR